MGTYTLRIRKKGCGRGNNSKGTQFGPGRSGNLRGRPRKPAPSYDFVDMLVESLCKLREVGSGDRQKMMTAMDMICERIVMVIPKAKPNELIALLRFFETFGVITGLQRKAEKEADIDPETGFSRKVLAMIDDIERKYLVDFSKPSRPSERRARRMKRCRRISRGGRPTIWMQPRCAFQDPPCLMIRRRQKPNCRKRRRIPTRVEWTAGAMFRPSHHSSSRKPSASRPAACCFR